MKKIVFDVNFTDMAYIKNRIENCIDEFCEEYNITDLSSETQNRFNACLRYIYEHVFKATPKVKVDNRTKTLLDTDNIDLVLEVLEYYIYLCDIYSKAVSVQGFSTLTGIDYTIIYDWKNGVNRNLNSLYSDIYKRLDGERERTLSDLLVSGKRQPIGVLAVLNHEKGWNLPGTSKEVRHVASVEDASTIAERYKARISDSSGDSSGDDSTG